MRPDYSAEETGRFGLVWILSILVIRLEWQLLLERYGRRTQKQHAAQQMANRTLAILACEHFGLAILAIDANPVRVSGQDSWVCQSIIFTRQTAMTLSTLDEFIQCARLA